VKISIAGLGYLGLPLARTLQNAKFEIIGTTTSSDKKVALLRENIPCEFLRSPDLPSKSISQCDWLVLNIPPFEGQPDWFRSWDLSETKRILFVSSTSALREGPNSALLREEEAWIRGLSIPSTIVRPAGLIGHGRHPGKHLAGKSAIKGRLNPVNLIHMDDVVGFMCTIVQKEILGETIEVVSDEHHTKEEFYSEYCRRNNLPLPEFDQDDHSPGSIISNEKMKRYYQLKFPTMLGRSL
jgi:nucleoside-diphosphate-sugar epimerase